MKGIEGAPRFDAIASGRLFQLVRVGRCPADIEEAAGAKLTHAGVLVFREATTQPSSVLEERNIGLKSADPHPSISYPFFQDLNVVLDRDESELVVDVLVHEGSIDPDLS